jgi:hypothetical protein
MHNPAKYAATFSGLIMTAFGKEQVLKLRITLTLYQQRDSPEEWTFTPTLPTGRPHPVARSPIELVQLIEPMFVDRLTEWTKVPDARPTLHHQRPEKVVPIDQIRRRA